MDQQSDTLQGIELLLRVVVQGLHCCLDLQRVERVVPLTAVSTVPEAPSYLAGLLNLGGSVIPVIDLGLRLGLPSPEPYTLDTPIVVCTDGDSRLGLIVSQVIGVRRTARPELQLRKLLEDSNLPFSAVFASDEELIFLLDWHRLATSTSVMCGDYFVDPEWLSALKAELAA